VILHQVIVDLVIVDLVIAGLVRLRDLLLYFRMPGTFQSIIEPKNTAIFLVFLFA